MDLAGNIVNNSCCLFVYLYVLTYFHLALLAGVFSQNHGEAKDKLAAKVKEEQALRSSLPALSRQILGLDQTRTEITVKEIEGSTGTYRNTIKVHVKKPAADHYLIQVGKGCVARHTLK